MSHRSDMVMLRSGVPVYWPKFDGLVSKLVLMSQQGHMGAQVIRYLFDECFGCVEEIPPEVKQEWVDAGLAHEDGSIRPDVALALKNAFVKSGTLLVYQDPRSPDPV